MLWVCCLGELRFVHTLQVLQTAISYSKFSATTSLLAPQGASERLSLPFSFASHMSALVSSYISNTTGLPHPWFLCSQYSTDTFTMPMPYRTVLPRGHRARRGELPAVVVNYCSSHWSPSKNTAQGLILGIAGNQKAEPAPLQNAPWSRVFNWLSSPGTPKEFPPSPPRPVFSHAHALCAQQGQDSAEAAPVLAGTLADPIFASTQNVWEVFTRPACHHPRY